MTLFFIGLLVGVIGGIAASLLMTEIVERVFFRERE